MSLRIPTSYINKRWRSALRFCVLGLTGTLVQSGFFVLVLYLFSHPDKNTVSYYFAYGMGFILEMIPNFILSNYYVFETRPSLNRAGGFLIARGVNLLIQFGFLPLLLFVLPMVSDDLISILCIILAGIVNYFVLRFFFVVRDDNKQKISPSQDL